MSRKKTASKKSYFLTEEFHNICAGSILLMLAILVFFATQDITGNGQKPLIGKYLSQGGLFLFGEYYRVIFCPIVGLLGIMILTKKAYWSGWRLIGLLLFFISLTSLTGWYTGEVAFFNLYISLEQVLGPSSALIFFLLLLFASLYMVVRVSWRTLLSHVRKKVPSMTKIKDFFPEPEPYETLPKSRSKNEKALMEKQRQLEKQIANIQKEKTKTPSPLPLKKMQEKKDGLFRGLKEKKIPLHSSNGVIVEAKNAKNTGAYFGSWNFPDLKLLNTITHKNRVSQSEIEEKSLIIQSTFLQFGIDVEMERECVGPTVIQYRLCPSEGVHLTKLKNLKDNLTLALKAKSIRIQAPIPGLGLVGIEVPNELRDVVGIQETLASKNFHNASSNLTLALGKDINGDFIVGDLAKMPHLLIAGQTGSGKSVGMNGFILSLLYKNTPSELRMIMIDPKQVELGIYDGIPHLLTPVINQPEKALNSLKWAVAEMERRYSILKPTRCRNREEYNKKVTKKDALPAIVIIIDELADLMMSGNKKDVEIAITRIAQKARAVGIHMIVATQRPSVDVITGLIKANIPSRMAFTVASGVDSKTILDTVGAEDLLGRGDMLYFPTGAPASIRLQGVLVETDEVERVVNFIKRTIDPAMLEDIYDASVIEGDRGNFEGSIAGGGSFDEDPKIIEAAIELARSSGKCSTSMFQRHLKLGYGRAARVVDILEAMGIVGPADGSKPREVL